MASTESVSHNDLIVCVCGNLEYKARDAIEAALFRGELGSRWKEFLRRVESEKSAEELDKDLDEDAFDSAAEAFRYEHDLITAEETEQWLAARGLTLDDFSGYFSRQCWGAAITEKVNLPEIDYLSATAELRDLFAAELTFSGELERLTTDLSWRLAALEAEKDADPSSRAAEKKNFFERNEMGPEQLSNWLQRFNRDAEWFDRMVAMDAAYRRRSRALLVPQAYQNELTSLRLPLTRFETEVIELESRDAAQEAVFCVREDGMSMEQVATEGRYPYRRVDFVLEDMPDEQQQRFLSVTDGEVMEPTAHADGFEVCRVLKKIEPRADDPAVQLRVEQRLLERHFSELAGRLVERRLGISASSK